MNEGTQTAAPCRPVVTSQKRQKDIETVTSLQYTSIQKEYEVMSDYFHFKLDVKFDMRLCGGIVISFRGIQSHAWLCDAVAHITIFRQWFLSLYRGAYHS
jgi:hypothetical protein